MDEKNKIERLKLGQNGFSWLNINKPDEEVISYLKRTYKFHHLDLEDCLSELERPKIDDYEEYLFIVLQIPIKTTHTKRIKNSELNIFISQNYVITLSDEDPTINNLFEDCTKTEEIKEDYMSKGTGYFLYRLISTVFDSANPLLKDLNRQLNDLEKDVFDSDYSRDHLKEILLLKKDVINFRRIIIPQRSIIAQLEHKNKKFLPDNLDVYFDDVVDKIEKIWNSLENVQELITSLHETNESIISHNTNNVIKILTLFSVIMLPLTVITGYYGMNVKGLPYAEHSLATIFVAGIMFLVSLSMISYFRYKKWI